MHERDLDLINITFRCHFLCTGIRRFWSPANRLNLWWIIVGPVINVTDYSGPGANYEGQSGRYLSYRGIFAILESDVIVLRIGHRRDIYR